MIAKPEWFEKKKSYTGRTHLKPVGKEGWLYYLGVLVVLFTAQVIHPLLVIAVMALFVVDIFQVMKKIED